MTTLTMNNFYVKTFSNNLSSLVLKMLQVSTDSGFKIKKSENVIINETRYNKQPMWEREETVVLVAEYFRTCNLSKREQEKSIEFVSKLLRIRAKKLGLRIDKKYRNVTGIRMKFANIMSLDKNVIKNGLKNASTLEKQIVNEYYFESEKINQEAYFTIMKYINI